MAEQRDQVLDAFVACRAFGASEHELGDTDVAFIVALLVWFAATGEHAIRHHTYLDNPRSLFRAARRWAR